ncbi:MAG: hypothetical protein KGQ41_01495 [Alphaproteobacteria bacterium]|nr:hypothetical protein [Alphaproteobacteria bacterium]
MSKKITATFQNRFEMESALRQLTAIGVGDGQIGVIMNDETHGKSFRIKDDNKSDEGMVAGATVGGIATGLLAAVAGAGTLAIPGLSLVVAGPVVAGLAGAGLGAAAGGIVGGLIGLGIPEHEAKLYQGEIKAGRILLAVEALDDKQAQQVKRVFENAHALNIAA